MDNDYRYSVKELGFNWETKNPFLFCVHHNDRYPRGNDEMGPDASLAGRNLGMDFTPKEGWRMYHGRTIPGFPEHPHRGFETITIVLKSFVDHADSMGAAGRYGEGDVQWMTAGAGMQHCEMFPLLDKDGENHLELFQIWINLPAAKKFVTPYYRMLWSEDIPVIDIPDAAGRKTTARIIAGSLNGTDALPPTPDSWAAAKENRVAIWLVTMEPEAEWEIPADENGVNRTLYYYLGDEISVNDQRIGAYKSVDLDPEEKVTVTNGMGESRLLLLQGKPIDEPVVQYGPFVMNSEREIQQAYDDYRKTRFGGWPWPRPDMAHDRSRGRFALFPDGSEETRP